MAHNVEPMDIDSDFDKENNVHNSNVYLRTSCTEKGYEELDVSELNMKLRYSVTPAASPMSKSYTANCIENKNLETGDDNLNANLTRSLNSALPKNNIVNKSVKSLPLQPISAEQFLDKNWNPSSLRPLDSTHVVNTADVTITVSATNDNNNDNFETPSPSSSTVHTPDAVTPTKELPRTDDGSPIMRGLKSVLNMFRSSQSPIPPECGDGVVKQVLTADDISYVDSISSKQPSQAVLASTPIGAHKSKETAKRSSPLKESIVFNEDLEKELLWKDETAIFFKEEKIPIHKLFYPPPLTGFIKCNNEKSNIMEENLNATVEYMDISYCNDSVVKDQTTTDIQSDKQLIAAESDGEFVDCETTFTNDKSGVIDDHDSDKMVMIENNDNPQTNSIDSIQPTPQNYEMTIVCNNISTQANASEANVELSLTKNMPDDDLLQQRKIDINNDNPQINSIDSIQPTQQNYETTIVCNNISTQANASEANVELSLTKNMPDDDLLQQRKIDNISIDNDHEISSNNKVKTFESLPPTDINKMEEAKSPEYLNEFKKTKENIEQSFDNQHDNEIQLNKNLGFGCLNTEPIQSNPDLQVFEVVSPLDSSDKTSDRNHSVNTPAPEEFSELTPIKFVLDDQSIEVEKECIVPANIPLPEEDNFDIEIPSNGVGSTSALYSPIIKNKLFDTELESTAHVDSMPNNPAVLANKDENKVTCSDIDSIAVGIHIQKIESNLEDSLISKHAVENSHNDIGVSQTVNDFTLGIKSDIDNIVREAKLIVEEKQKLIPACENLNLKKDEHSEPKNENFTVNAEPSLRNAESPLNNHNDEVSNNFKSEIMESVVNNNEMCNPCAYNMMNTTETYKDELIHADTYSPSEIIVDGGEVPQDIQGPIEIINNDVILASDKNKLDLNICCESELATSMINTTNINYIQELSTVAKTDLMPDAIPDAMVCNIRDQLPVEVIKHIAENKDIVKDTVSETTTEKSLFPHKDEKVDIETISKTTTNEILFKNKDEVEVNIDEDATLSEHNSPFVSIDHGTNQAQAQLNLDECMNPFATKSNIDECMNPFATKSNIAVSPPISPKISSKGYNFNFDEIDDPFATKTKIRLSPPPNSPEGTVAEGAKEKSHQRDKNRRKSQPERKKPIAKKNIINKTFSGAVNVLDRQSTIQTADSFVIGVPLDSNSQDNSLTSDSGNANNVILINENELHSKMSSFSTEKTDNSETEILKEQIEIAVKLKNEAGKSDEVITEENKTSVDSLISSNEVRHTSSSEQSAYYSAETSTVSTKNKNVFNIPEIDDVNFNPFITKSKICKSPSPIKNDSFSYKLDNSSEESCPINKTSEASEDKECGNISNITCSSKATDDKDVTVREVEVHTEDEDTIEGPFLETEDLNNVDKISDFDCEDADMMQFSELPTQSNEEQLEGEEMFIDAEAFEFLLNQNKSSAVADSGKESLFLKFDPLFAKRVSTDGVLAALNKVQKRQSTPKKVSVAQQLDTTFEKPFPGPSNLNVTNKPQTIETVEESLDDPVTVSKPMMVVTPAVNPIAKTRNKSVTPASSNRRSITFTSPAIAVIDRLLNMSGNNSLFGHDNTMTQVNSEQNEADHALTQLRELLAEKEIQVYNLRSESKELKDRLSTLESQMRALESDGEERLKKINDLNEKLAEKTKINKSMAAVVEEYERTIASLIAESEQDKKRHNEERIKLVKERDEQTAHLASMEVSFSDLHSKYEKSKQIILTCKANEDAYKKSIKEFEANLSKMQSNYELLKQHATSKLNHANQELEKMNKAHEAEVLKLNAMIKRKELHITSLEETLAQKTKANEELTAICDELINKVG